MHLIPDAREYTRPKPPRRWTLTLKTDTAQKSKAYPGGRMCYHFEEPVHRFQNMVAGLMAGASQIPAGDDYEQAPVLSRGR